MAERYAVRLVVAYDGTDFCGWQRQPGVRTVQGVLEEAIATMSGSPAKTRGVSRTDSGVHAYDQRVAFDTERPIGEYGWQQGLNQHLPDDVRVRAVRFDEPGYDPRHHARGKLYRYLTQVGYARDPLLRHRACYLGASHRTPGPRVRPETIDAWLDVDAMRVAARALTGTHDFGAFQASNDERTDRVRTVHRIDVMPDFSGRTDVLAIEVEGDGFLKNMVRILAGTLLDVGRRHRPPTDIDKLLADRDRREAGPTAPAAGLYLVRVDLHESAG
ncbi:MAG: tRNA pseudouridine(38-40) synthase TruA [Myxococcota bacterium]